MAKWRKLLQPHRLALLRAGTGGAIRAGEVFMPQRFYTTSAAATDGARTH